jgi:SMODS and SLOG-associating 2TM effector domain 2
MQTGSLRTASLSAVFAHAVRVSSAAQAWYAEKRPSKRAWGRTLRVLAILLGAAGAVLPIVAEITSTSGKPAIAPGWATVALTMAVACVGLDRYFGFSSGWMRFMAAEQRLVRQRHDFEYRWNETPAALADDLTDADVSTLLSLAHANVPAVQEIITGETAEWLTDFRGALAEAERSLTATHRQ